MQVPKKNVFAIIGSASQNSANKLLVKHIAEKAANNFTMTIYEGLKLLPHFDPELSIDNSPAQVVALRQAIDHADGIIICTPEYVFSIPSGLKNAIEWCVSTTIFSDKPLGIITASASGKKGHEELQLIMNTVMAKFTPETTLLIEGVKGKINEKGDITNERTTQDVEGFIAAFKLLLENDKRLG